MEGAAVIGLDLAKNLFQVHGVAADGGVVIRRQLRRAQMLPLRLAWSGWKPAHLLITGRVN